MKTYCFSCGHPNDSFKTKVCESCGDPLAAKAYVSSHKKTNKASSPKRGKPAPNFNKNLTEDDEEFWESDDFEGHDYDGLAKLKFSFHIPKNSFRLGDIIKIEEEGS